MEIPNKYRGIRKLTGKPIYGELYRFSFATMIKTDGIFYPVKPKSVCKLAGYDKDGNEIYRSCKK